MRESLYPVENNIPLPKPAQGRPKYPFSALELRQSFIVPCEDWDRERVMNSLTSCRANAQRHGKKFAMRQVPSGVRVWRVL